MITTNFFNEQMKYAKAVHDTFVTNTLPAEDSTEETAEETTEETEGK